MITQTSVSSQLLDTQGKVFHKTAYITAALKQYKGTSDNVHK